MSLEKMKKLVGQRPFPRDRMEAALFGYSEEEWQELVVLAKEIHGKRS